MVKLRFAMLGTGFWSQFQLGAWKELDGVKCVALYNRTRAKAEALANRFGVPAVYDDPDELLSSERLDFLDIVTDVDTHARFVELAAEHRIPVICQKPMAPTLAVAESMVQLCHETGTPFFVHENWRWQTPIRQVKRVLDQGTIGEPFRNWMCVTMRQMVRASERVLSFLCFFASTAMRKNKSLSAALSGTAKL